MSVFVELTQIFRPLGPVIVQHPTIILDGSVFRLVNFLQKLLRS